ncbi:MAG TPA: flagellar biosynthesis protein FliQ [Firmicutes bacterium]|jgi:flagellar biosynthetic protein FliQ|nr:flagellar biosynthesis protein FliQ [Bacillota bacterium]
MSEEFVLSLGRDALYTALLVAGPLLLLSLSVGLLVSIFQATTQIQEQTLSFVPKIVTVFLGLVIFGPWMLKIMRDFTVRLVSVIPTVLQ